jgi:arginyl-tRNA synthetase
VHERLEQLVGEAVERVIREIAPERAGTLECPPLAPPRVREHGDFASSAALALAKPLAMAPRVLAERIAAALVDPEGLVEKVEIAGPGFLNFRLSRGAWLGAIERVLREGPGFGRSSAGGGEATQVEFVSANPTGPLTIGHGRNAVLGDCVASLLEATGHKVTREYYFNDGGRQMRVLADSLRARYEQQLGRDSALPEEGYQGEYLTEIARALVLRHGEALLGADWSVFRDAATEVIFAEIRATLDRLGIRFDVYTNEHALYQDGRVEAALADLRAAGVVYEADGAVWMRATALGLERDRVLVKSSGEPTYLLPDVAYHREKFRRGFQRIIDVLGPDHIEQLPYVRAAARVLGHDGDRIEVLIYQWVNLRRGGELVKMSTRAATFVTTDEVLDEVGRDAFRYFMVERRADTHLDFDVDLARERSERNPVYKIQYAHARLCSIDRQARDRGFDLSPLDRPGGAPLARLELESELDLARRLASYPETVLHAARAREPQELTRYLLDLASAFHTYVSDGRRHRVLADDAGLALARLALARALRQTLANGLALLGIAAPERM